ncbi:hypothetical protein AVEN_67211-1 [Araneus ventricosus]|uniref:Uncharacterized protein n=1 Tax=Araneus ventricosus TaxID=182803 RepID=A0A4Y2TMD5_ARAVE|nr:hypothetical protein AVEN_67211-1 [Araneus ventricosus]
MDKTIGGKVLTPRRHKCEPLQVAKWDMDPWNRQNWTTAAFGPIGPKVGLISGMMRRSNCKLLPLDLIDMGLDGGRLRDQNR